MYNNSTAVFCLIEKHRFNAIHEYYPLAVRISTFRKQPVYNSIAECDTIPYLCNHRSVSRRLGCLCRNCWWGCWVQQTKTTPNWFWGSREQWKESRMGTHGIKWKVPEYVFLCYLWNTLTQWHSRFLKLLDKALELLKSPFKNSSKNGAVPFIFRQKYGDL